MCPSPSSLSGAMSPSEIPLSPYHNHQVSGGFISPRPHRGSTRLTCPQCLPQPQQRKQDRINIFTFSSCTHAPSVPSLEVRNLEPASLYLDLPPPIFLPILLIPPPTTFLRVFFLFFFPMATSGIQVNTPLFQKQNFLPGPFVPT